MKFLILLSLLVLVSCGKNGGGSSGTTSRSEINSPSVKCLDEKLGWIKTPPLSKAQVLEDVALADIDACNVNGMHLDLYMQQVSEQNRNLNF